MSGPEHKVQVAIIKYLRIVMPQAMIQHCRNESGKAKGRGGMASGMIAKAAGVMPGFPDLIVLPSATVGPFFLEVKAAKGRVQENQMIVHDMLRHRGYKVAVVKSIEDVRDFLTAESIPFNEVII